MYALSSVFDVYFDVKIAEWVEFKRVTMCISTLGATRVTRYCAVAYINIISKPIIKHL